MEWGLVFGGHAKRGLAVGGHAGWLQERMQDGVQEGEKEVFNAALPEVRGLRRRAGGFLQTCGCAIEAQSWTAVMHTS